MSQQKHKKMNLQISKTNITQKKKENCASLNLSANIHKAESRNAK